MSAAWAPTIVGSKSKLCRQTAVKLDSVTNMAQPIKPRPNHQRVLQILRSTSPQQKLDQVFKLNDRTLMLMRIGLRQRYPDFDEATLEKLYLQMRERCHNRNY